MVVRAAATKKDKSEGPAASSCRKISQHAAAMMTLDRAHGDEGRAKVSLTTAQTIQRARIARGWTQKQLAQAINEKPANIVSCSAPSLLAQHNPAHQQPALPRYYPRDEFDGH